MQRTTSASANRLVSVRGPVGDRPDRQSGLVPLAVGLVLLETSAAKKSYFVVTGGVNNSVTVVLSIDIHLLDLTCYLLHVLVLLY